MPKTKGGRSVNPTDAFRKEERRKQVNRNKLERKFQREAHRKINNASSLKAELNSIIGAEQSGTLNKTMRLKKKVLKDAYDHALRKQRETEIRTQTHQEEEEDEEEVGTAGASMGLQINVPIPPPPPLPPGEPPKHAETISTHLLPPPHLSLPHGFALPPPPGMPPGMCCVYPTQPPLMPMYSLSLPGRVAPLYEPMRKTVIPERKSTADVVKEHRPTITAASTVIKKPLAQDDVAITSMIPASVKIKRPATQVTGSSVRKPDLAPGAQNTEPQKTDTKDGPSQTSMEQKMAAFLSEVQELGAFDT